MYIPASFNVADRTALHDHIRTYGFATLVTLGKAGLTAT
jgi:predicted FMN-binding regulatory protein PaiB